MRTAAFDREQIRAWEQRWFAQANSSYGLMQQAAWQMARAIVQQQQGQPQAQPLISAHSHNTHLPPAYHRTGSGICCAGIWCGTGNNGGDGWLIAAYLAQAGWTVWVYESQAPHTASARLAKDYALQQSIQVYSNTEQLPAADVQVDALFGIGANRPLSAADQAVIATFNQQIGYKIAIDMPSGIDANSGTVLGQACEVDLTLTVLGYKVGLFTGQGAAYRGEVRLIELIPVDHLLQPVAYLDQHVVSLPKRRKTSHKGSNGHVLVVGGDENMGGAAMMAAEAALAVGAGKVTLLTHHRHHSAALSRSPNLMTLAIPKQDQITPQFAEQVTQGIDCVVIGVGLGREQWGKAIWQAFLPLLQGGQIQQVIIDADALWHLADEISLDSQALEHWSLTPHPGEAARLLGNSTSAIEHDRVAAIKQLKQRYGGNWVLKGAGSLTLDQDELHICTLGNAGMATAGMGDILAGMAGGLRAQFAALPLHQIVALHAAAGDLLAERGERGLQATEMLGVLKQVVN